jgi:XTP/dITP diphosphohydrolase
MKEVLFISGNKWKVREVSDMLSSWEISVKQQEIDVDEIQEKDVEKVARKKAEDLFNIVKVPLLVEDTGLHLEAMNGYPGSLIKHFLVAMDNSGVIRFLEGRSRNATAVTVFAYCDEKGMVHTFRGEKQGRICDDIKVSSDFDWDCMFIPEGYEQTYAEIGAETKNGISQRRIALEKFAEWFQKH